jgi:putative transposase
MARLPRLRIVEFPFHVIVRGTNQQPIFRGEGDRVFFHRALNDAAVAHGMSIHAYVFMTNHVHLLATGSSADSISKTIQALGRRYVRYFNFVHGRTGALWQGRFYSSVVDTDRYFLICQRYIELNPVRAGVCRDPVEFPWSSHRHYARATPDDLVTPHSIHATYDHSQYCRIFDDPVPAQDLQAIRDAVNHGWALGDDSFLERLGVLTVRRGKRERKGRRKRES